MNDTEKKIDHFCGIEAAAAYRAVYAGKESSSLGKFLVEFTIRWEMACRKILGERAYLESRRKRYRKELKAMLEEKEKERVHYLDEQSLMRALKELEGD